MHDGGYESGNLTSGLWCEECGNLSYWMFMVNEDLWLEHADKDEVICYHCFEARMGRPLTVDDLREYAMKNPYNCNRSFIEYIV